MAQTTSALVFDPEVYADMAQAEFVGSVKVAGSPAVKEDNTLEGSPGSTITFPKWNTLAELADLTEGTPIVPEAMGQTDTQATIKEAGAAVEVTDTAALVALGDPLAEAARQFGVLASRKIDTDLIGAALDTLPASYDVAAPAGRTKLSWDAIVDGITAFGDQWEPEQFAGIYINSAQQAELFRDANFLNAQTLGQMGTPIARGQIGSAGGVPVKVSDRIAAGTFLIVKNSALGLLYKRRPLVESDRDILARSTVVTTTIHYAVKRLNDKGVARVTLAAA